MAQLFLVRRMTGLLTKHGILIIGAIAILHLGLSLFAFVESVGMAAGRSGSGAAATFLERVLGTFGLSWCFPVALVLPDQWFEGLADWIPVAFNSMLWATLVFYACKALVAASRKLRGVVQPYISHPPNV